MKKYSRISALIALVPLMGCAVTSQNFSPVNDIDANEGLIYVFYGCDKDNDQWNKTATGPHFYLDGRKLGYLAPNTYVPIKMTQGIHNIKVTKNWNFKDIPELDLEVPVNDGDVIYIEYSFFPSRNGADIVVVSKFQEMSEVDALNIIVHCELQNDLLMKLEGPEPQNNTKFSSYGDCGNCA